MKPCTTSRFRSNTRDLFRRVLLCSGTLLAGGGCCLGQHSVPGRHPLTAPDWKHEVLRTGVHQPDMHTNLPKSWQMSVLAVVAAQAGDSVSSWGAVELNPVLAPRPGMRFDGRAAGVKFGIIGALLLTEYVIVRRNPERSKRFTRLNWGLAAVTSAIAARNFAVR
ncbi:MAG: hypothetical protein K2X35_22755 [Bryobacteraceae bacterium]|nr:hypothetical protein [Bryobacteraceae bacterium]